MKNTRTFAFVVSGAATVAALAALAGQASAAVGAAADPCKSPTRFKGERAGIYHDYCGICRDTGWKEIKHTYQLKGATARVIAQNYAAFDHFGAVLPPASQGCYRGFVLRGKP
jgi:hypothetical protein